MPEMSFLCQIKIWNALKVFLNQETRNIQVIIPQFLKFDSLCTHVLVLSILVKININLPELPSHGDRLKNPVAMTRLEFLSGNYLVMF